ncbi:nuclear transcription factor Y subunit beta isoform X1 [Glossina fuscipes]|uniref:Nuclear transcription factor Y subunit beta isoform X1 n=2 Tax=Glossina fuscipes TaxID=7396 RepID=A0A8U0W653_9MUSC|nr:nuclear transcription factor Y subunit beta isoform X1 [Glossina fuscipes]
MVKCNGRRTKSCFYVMLVTEIYQEVPAIEEVKMHGSNKFTEKLGIYPKKVTVLKKRLIKPSLKKAADITEKFKNLPEEDLLFIKELDKQFHLHGAKIKFKIEHVNVTDHKSSKRTIEGDLGYGYSQHGYDYTPPKFMFYPYSQKDIPPDAPSYYIQDEKNSITIEPSYSYQLKTESFIQSNHAPHIDVPHASNVLDGEDPVIVLRIPGPPKYASHLKTLLQQYLEIRAAQYLHILEETEHRKRLQLQQPQQQQQQQQHHDDYSQVKNQAAVAQQQAAYEQSQQHDQEGVATPENINNYEGYKYDATPNQGYYAQQPPQHHHLSNVRPFYATPEQQFTHPKVHDNRNYQQAYLLAITTQPQFDYDSEQQFYMVEEGVGQSISHPSLPTAENNPRSSHTKIIFTHNTAHASDDYSQNYPLPSIKPNERYTPTSVPGYHQDFQARSQLSQESRPAVAVSSVESNRNAVVAITQRPFNYHAHAVKQLVYDAPPQKK